MHNVTVMLALSIATATSGCIRPVPAPYEVQLDVTPALTRPLEPFPKLPPIQEDGNRDFCDMHQYRVQLEFALCAEYKRTDNFIGNLTDGRQGFAVPKECDAIRKGVGQLLHKACEVNK